jgi:hypothetical protein
MTIDQPLRGRARAMAPALRLVTQRFALDSLGLQHWDQWTNATTRKDSLMALRPSGQWRGDLKCTVVGLIFLKKAGMLVTSAGDFAGLHYAFSAQPHMIGVAEEQRSRPPRPYSVVE